MFPNLCIRYIRINDKYLTWTRNYFIDMIN